MKLAQRRLEYVRPVRIGLEHPPVQIRQRMNHGRLGLQVLRLGHLRDQALQRFGFMQMLGHDVIPDRQHHPPELRAPVADVVLADDFVLLEFQNPADGVADDGASQMPDVDFLGDVRAGIIDDDILRLHHCGDAEAPVEQLRSIAAPATPAKGGR